MLAQIGKNLQLEYPLLGYLLAGTDREEGVRDLTVRLAVGERAAPVLQWGRELADLSERQQWQQLGHELLHLALGHPFLVGGYPHGPAIHLACDWLVNRYLLEMGLAPEGFSGLPGKQPEDLEQAYQCLVSSPDLSGLAAEYAEAVSRHAGWMPAGSTSLEAARLQTGARLSWILEAARWGGELPEGLEQALRLALPQSSGPDWRSRLYRFLRNSRRTYAGQSLRRPSRRYGTYPGLRVRPRGRLVVILDTSASISETSLALFWREVHRIYRSGIIVHILEADVVVRRSYPFHGRIPESVAGRGGTNFDPAIERAEQSLAPDAILYFTDGQGPPPYRRKGTPLLWVLPAENDGAHLPGEKVYLR